MVALSLVAVVIVATAVVVGIVSSGQLLKNPTAARQLMASR